MATAHVTAPEGNAAVIGNSMAFPLTEVKARLGISRSTAYIEIAAGRLKAIKVGSRTLITAAAAHEWLQQLPALGDANKAA